jgi:dTDP-4-amino-4,6-dideoxygalactose transaminase
MQIPLLDLKIQNSKVRKAATEKFSKVFDSGEFILGAEVETFENSVAEYLGTRHAIGVSSGTDALLVALMAIGIKEGDEVICPSFTFFATASCVARLGAKPVFADINLHDFNISTDDIRRKITKNTRAILPVHLFGQPADIEEIIEIGRTFNLHVVEDAAQSFGAKQGNRQTGTFGTTGCFSFFPTKNLGGFGDSGLVCTDDDDLADRIKILRVHGMRPQYFHSYIGGNFRIDEMQAALLSLKLPYVDDYIARRRENAKIYREELDGVNGIVLPTEMATKFHTWNQFTVRILDGQRDRVWQILRESGVGCNVYYPLPLDAQKCFSHFVHPQDLTPNAATAAKEVLSLPIYPELEHDKLLYVAKIFKHALGCR